MGPATLACAADCRAFIRRGGSRRSPLPHVSVPSRTRDGHRWRLRQRLEQRKRAVNLSITHKFQTSKTQKNQSDINERIYLWRPTTPPHGNQRWRGLDYCHLEASSSKLAVLFAASPITSRSARSYHVAFESKRRVPTRHHSPDASRLSWAPMTRFWSWAQSPPSSHERGAPKRLQHKPGGQTATTWWQTAGQFTWITLNNWVLVVTSKVRTIVESTARIPVSTSTQVLPAPVAVWILYV